MKYKNPSYSESEWHIRDKHIFVTTTLKLGCHGNFGPGATPISQCDSLCK